MLSNSHRKNNPEFEILISKELANAYSSKSDWQIYKINVSVNVKHYSLSMMHIKHVI